MNDLLKQAIEARKNAYVPYSQFKVGAAILLKNGEVIKGSNIENASFGLTNCAERSALYSLYSQGYKKEDIVAIAVSGDTESPISPCGACRQVMMELVPSNTPIYLTNLRGDVKETSTKELLPYAFVEVEHHE